MGDRHVIVCEKQSFLTASLEREFGNSRQIRFRWVAYLDDFFRHMETDEYNLAIVDAELLNSESITRLSTVTEQRPVLAMVPAEDFEFEDFLREQGVTSVLPNGTAIHRIAQVVTKILFAGE